MRSATAPVKASSRSAPVSMPAISSAALSSITAGRQARPFLSTAMAATPSSVPCTEPVPPKMLVPPRTTAVMANNS